eukprot:7178902-Prymnesium_polylepis.1
MASAPRGLYRAQSEMPLTSAQKQSVVAEQMKSLKKERSSLLLRAEEAETWREKLELHQVTALTQRADAADHRAEALVEQVAAHKDAAGKALAQLTVSKMDIRKLEESVTSLEAQLARAIEDKAGWRAMAEQTQASEQQGNTQREALQKEVASLSAQATVDAAELKRGAEDRAEHERRAKEQQQALEADKRSVHSLAAAAEERLRKCEEELARVRAEKEAKHEEAALAAAAKWASELAHARAEQLVEQLTKEREALQAKSDRSHERIVEVE